MRDQCEVKGAGCEVFTRCVAVHTGDRIVLACTVCAERMGVPLDIIVYMVDVDSPANGDEVFMPMPIHPGEHVYVGVSPPRPPRALDEYTKNSLHANYGSLLALSQ